MKVMTHMEKEMISLTGRDTLTVDQTTAYRVIDGTVLVFVVPLNPQTGRPMQRRLLCECTDGAQIPPLKTQQAGTDGEQYGWTLLLMPLEEAKLEAIPQTKELQQSFLEFCEDRLHGVDKESSYEEQIVEFYNLCTIREMRNLYAVEKESKEAEQRSIQSMIRVFRKDRATRGSSLESRTGKPLYDAMARLCSWQEIPIEKEENVRSCYGKNYTTEDIAGISHFACRLVTLPSDWTRKEVGPFLAFYSDGEEEDPKIPVACIPAGSSGYYIWNPLTDEATRVTSKVKQKIVPKGYVLYRPFPDEKITLWKLIQFGMHELYAKDVLLILLMGALGQLLGLIQTDLSQKLFDVLIPAEEMDSLQGICVVVMSCALGGLAFSVVRGLANFRAIARMRYAIDAAVLDRLFNLPESFYRDYDSADLASRAMGVGAVFSKLAQTAIGTWLTAAFTLVYLGRMIKFSASLTAVCMLLLILVLIVMSYLGVLQLRLERENMECSSRISSFLNQLILGIQKIRTSGAEDRAMGRYMELFTHRSKLARKSGNYSRYSGIVSSGGSTLFTLAIYWMVIRSAAISTSGVYLGFTSAFGFLSAAMLSVLESLLDVNRVLPSLERMKPILETLPELQEGAQIPQNLTGNISIGHVSFRYEADGPAVLKDLSMEIKAGEYIGIVGPSGCGKSTLLKLLLGFEKPESGRIFYDSYDLEDLEKREFRRCCGTVLQNGGLIPGSIAENIAITRPTATKEEIEEAIKLASLEEDVAQMPMGIFTMLSEGDGTISGGQKQRILIARAILGKPKILFMDEATSALDNTTQKAVCESLDRMGCTRIVIAHRLSTIMNCDRIYVLKDGVIEECGNYQELMEKRGFFYELAKRQLA